MKKQTNREPNKHFLKEHIKLLEKDITERILIFQRTTGLNVVFVDFKRKERGDDNIFLVKNVALTIRV